MSRNLKNQLVQPAGRRRSDSLVPEPGAALAAPRPGVISAPKRLLETLQRAPANFIQRGFFPQTLLASRIANVLAMREPQAVRKAYAIYLASLRNPKQLITFRREGTDILSAERLRLARDRVLIDYCKNPAPLTDEAALEAVEEDKIVYLVGSRKLSVGRSGFEEASSEKISEELASSRLLIPFGKNYGMVEISGIDLRLMGFWQTQFSVLGFARDFANLGFMRVISDTDALTGLSNRRIFDETAEQYFGDYTREGINSALLMLDIDKFKRTNDIYGHAGGDKVLAHVAAIISQSLRTTDVVTLTRYGGEEFAILLPGADTKGGAIAAERCRAQLEANPAIFQGHTIEVTGSFGVSSFFDAECLAKGNINPESELGEMVLIPQGEQGTGILELTHKLTDEALYKAKEEGRNKVVIASVDPKTQIFSLESSK